ncbi:hypothetical protein E4Z61_21285 [Citrobacter tructae]|uniref:Uncharacterized protein n=1 Tax=Citrobacter tructae TaxID=2562449 RepID=A0ABX5T9P8_9ENTR|nr:hypothetical protein E4Z61_21285 [Citrobacter tructae]
MQTTIKIPEVLIGEIIRYALRTLSLAPTCADAQVFFRLCFRIPFTCRAHPPTRIICHHSSLYNRWYRELRCY